MPTPKHNPQSIPLSEIPPGWRLCRESEREKLPADAKFLTYLQGQPNWWKDSCGQVKALEHWKEYTYITFTPLPESEREVEIEDEHFRLTRGPGQKFVMSHFEKEASPWIPLSERVPTEQDWGADRLVEVAGPNHRLILKEICYELYRHQFTHWRRVELPPLPPAPAKTQREKDDAAFEESYKKLDLSVTTSHEVYFAALETERAHFGGRSAGEVAKEIKRVIDEENSFKGISDSLRALLSPPKEGETKT